MASTNGDTVGEFRENIPLRTGTKKRIFNISCKKDCLEGSRLITLSFISLTIAITISLIVQIYYGDYQIVPHGSVATDSSDCSAIGVDILKRGGNAIDAGIASTLCLTVVNPHNTGLDANGIMMIYNHRTRNIPDVIDFSSISDLELDGNPLTPLILGLAFAHLNYGKLPWRDLVKPAANLASQGFAIDDALAEAIAIAKVENFFNNTKAHTYVKLLPLSSTLWRIADIPKEHLKKYLLQRNDTIRSNAIETTFNNYNIYVPNLPSSGPIVLANLQHIEYLNITESDIPTPEYVYQLAELLRDVYTSLKVSERYHEGTSSNVAVIDMDDNYVSIVTGMYDFFGSKERTLRGYFLDKKQQTRNAYTLLPIIITDEKYVCGRRIVMGSGDLSVATQIITSLLTGNNNVTSSIEGPRFKLVKPNTIGIEDSHYPRFSEVVTTYLRSIGQIEVLPEPYGSCNIVEITGDDLSSHSDSRGYGIAYRFK